MRKYLLLIIVGVYAVVDACHAQSAIEAIENHRQWMAKHYPKPDTLSQDALLKEAALTIAFGLREPEAKTLLTYTAQTVPQLNDYVAWLDSNKPDYHFKASINASDALAQASEKILGKYHDVTAWCRYFALDIKSNMQNVVPQAEKALKDQQIAVKKHPTRETQALLCMMRLAFIQFHLWDDAVVNPKYYTEIVNIEREALKLYPLNDEAASLTRAMLYLSLARMKENMTSQIEANEAEEKAGWLEESVYKITSNGVKSNAEYYYDCACNMFRTIYSVDHPQYVSVCQGLCGYRESNFPLDRNWIYSRVMQREYTDNYYPEGSLECIMARIYLWNIRMLAAETNHDTYFYAKVADDLRQIYTGVGNPFYLNILQTVLTIAGHYYPQNIEDIANQHDTLVEQVAASDSIKKALYLNGLYFGLKDYIPERAEKKIKEAFGIYLRHHRADYLSVLLGQFLSQECFFVVHNDNLALQTQECLCEDMRKLYGADSPSTLNEEVWKLAIMGTIDEHKDKLHELYPTLIERMKTAGADYRVAMGYYADYEFYSQNNYEKAEQIYRQIITEESSDLPLAKRISNRLYLVKAMGMNGGSDKERETLYQEAVRMMDEDEDTLGIDVNNFSLAAEYLVEKGKYREAVAMLDRGIEWAKHSMNMNGLSIDYTYVDMLLMKDEILFHRLNDRAAGRRAVSEQLAELHIDQQHFWSTAVLDFLLGCYDIVKHDYGEDFSQIGFFYGMIKKLTQELYKQSGYEESFLMSYGVRSLFAKLELVRALKLYMEKYNVEDLVHQYDKDDDVEPTIELVKQILSNTNGAVADIASQLKNFEQRFPSYDTNYMNNGCYHLIIRGLATCYAELQPDFAEAEEYLKKYYVIMSDTPYNSYSVWCDLGYFYFINNKTVEAESAYQRAADELKKVKETTSEERLRLVDRLFSLYFSTGEYDKSVEPARLSFKCMKEIMDGSFQFMTETEQDNFMQTYGDPADNLTLLLSKYPKKIAAEVYDAVLYRTGMQLRSQRNLRNAISQSGDSNLIALLDSLTLLRKQESDVNGRRQTFQETKSYVDAMNVVFSRDEKPIVNVVKASSQQDENKRQSALLFSVNNLEQQIIKQSEPYLRQYTLNTTWQQVRDALKAEEVAVEYVFSDKEIMALVLRKDYESPVAVSLTCADTLRSRLASLGVTRTDKLAMKLYNDHSIDLYAMLWQPLEAYLQGVKTVYYCTPGILNNLSFAAFTTPDGGYLFDKYDLCQLMTTAALTRKRTEDKPSSALLMGGIFYSERQRSLAASGVYNKRGMDGDTDEDNRGFDDFTDAVNRDDRGGAREHFGYLKFTVKEMKSIESSLLEHGFGEMAITTSKESAASEQSFRECIECQPPSVVHLATHGFFIVDADKASTIPFYQKYNHQYSSNSMCRAGVALANAEPTWCGGDAVEEDDGILTAEEVSRLNLQKTQLVTLSACETALGDYSFEGVYGLPRGFKQAGVKSLLVSLWSVNDESTALLMTEFYNRWLGGTPMRQSLREAVKTVRARYPQPYYWAPFVLLDALD